MPQFSPEFFSTQIFWLVITFITLYVLMSTIALPKIGAVLEDRQRRIEENLDKAALLKGEAESAIKAYEKALADARANAQATIRAAAEAQALEAERQGRDLGAKLATQIKAGEAKVAEAKSQALASVRDVALDVASATISRLIGTQADQGQLTAAVGAALKEAGK